MIDRDLYENYQTQEPEPVYEQDYSLSSAAENGEFDWDSVAADIVESTSLVDMADDSPMFNFFSDLVANPSGFGGQASRDYAEIGLIANPAGAAPPAAKDDGPVSWLKSVFGDIMSDKDAKSMLLKMGLGAITGMAKDKSTKEVAKLNNSAAADLVTQRDQLEQAANKRFSDSVGGLRPVKRFKPKPLTRLDGSRVFGSNGMINSQG